MLGLARLLEKFMARLLLISLGKLTGTVLEAAARDIRFDSIVVAGRQTEYGRAKANQARIGAALEGRFPKIAFERFDFNEPGAARFLRRFAPDVAFAAPSLLPWWKIAASANPKAKAMPFAGWLACNLAPMQKLSAVWAESRLACPWIGAAYPDVVNAILAATGSAPTVGCGHIGEGIPQGRLSAGAAQGAPPHAI